MTESTRRNAEGTAGGTATRGAQASVTMTAKTVVYVVTGDTYHSNEPIAAYHSETRADARAEAERINWKGGTSIFEVYLDE